MLRRTYLHQGWTFTETAREGGRVGYSNHEWLPARVPGHVHLDLLENGVIAHPFERMHELGVQWVDEADWSYKTSFEWHPDPGRPRRVLAFEGLDTICKVYLNGELAAEHDNMFVPLELDVSQRLRAGTNELRIDFASPTRVGRERRAAWLAEQGLTQFERLEDRSFVRKVQCMYGWDWGPRLVSCGVWRPLSLLEYEARIVDVATTQEHSASGAVRLGVKAQSEGRGKLVHVLGDDAVLVGDGEIAIDRPRLWQPLGFGEPHLYTLRSFICPESVDLAALPKEVAAARALLESVALDVKSTRIGLRTVELRREQDAFGESFEFVVNGRKLWALGANWIPDHSFPSTLTAAQYRERVLQAKRSGMNMLRIWGGGLYELDEFYEACDELGILVWQDFAFACAYYPDTGTWQEAVRAEAEANVKRLRNHASLAMWCGNNENLTMYVQKWGNKDHQPPRYFGEHFYDRVLPDVLARLDPARPYIPSSPCGGKEPNDGGFGDQHYWDVWHGRGDWIHYRDSTARFASEYGFASSPSLAAWREVFSESRSFRSPDVPEVGLGSLRAGIRDPILRWHDKTLKGYETFIGYVELHYPQTSDVEAWTYFSQLNQRDAMRAAIEHYRRSEFCKGSLIWQINDCWPVQSWALIDSLGQPKAAWFELARLHAPGLVSLKREGGKVEVWVAFDNAPAEARLDGELTLRAHSLATGEALASFRAPVGLQSGTRACVLSADVANLPTKGTLLVARLGALSASMLLDEPKSVELGPAAKLEVSRAEDGVLALRSATPLVDLCLWDERGTASFAHNALTLAEPGVLRVGYSGSGLGLRARSLAGEHELSVVRSRL